MLFDAIVTFLRSTCYWLLSITRFGHHVIDCCYLCLSSVHVLKIVIINALLGATCYWFLLFMHCFGTSVIDFCYLWIALVQVLWVLLFVPWFGARVLTGGEILPHFMTCFFEILPHCYILICSVIFCVSLICVTRCDGSGKYWGFQVMEVASIEVFMWRRRQVLRFHVKGVVSNAVPMWRQWQELRLPCEGGGMYSGFHVKAGIEVPMWRQWQVLRFSCEGSCR